MNRRIRVFDTTLRDGDQAAGFSFDVRSKLEIARALAAVGVDVIEAGFPLSSPMDAESCALIAAEFSGSPVSTAVMCRAIPDEIRATALCLGSSPRGILHLSLPVSDLHIKVKFGIDRTALISRAVESVRFARSLASEIEMGAEDATRADRSFLAEYCDAVTSAGARTVNIADTVGRALPDELADLVSYLLKSVPAFRGGSSVISVHCHNDLGLATANTLAAIGSGCGQIEVCALGLGERAGNAALEEIAAALDTRRDSFSGMTGLILPAIGPLVRLVSGITGTAMSPLKPVTGSNVRVHASGIHQQALVRDIETYRSLDTGHFGTAPERMVLSRHSGRSGIESVAREYAGISLSPERAASLLDRIKADPSRDDSSYGITEFLFLLRSERLTEVSFFRCRDIAVSSSGNRCVLSGTFVLQDDREIRETGSGRTFIEAALDLVGRLCHIAITLRCISYSGYGRDTELRQRLYIEVIPADFPDRIFGVERTGGGLERLLVAALLDFVNSSRALRPSASAD